MSRPQCERSNKNYGPQGGLLKEKGAALFGYTDLYGGYDGGQAQFVRVPYADHGPRRVPATLTDEKVLFLSDIISTGYSGLKWANLQPGETVAVFGCGPSGLMTQKLARALCAAVESGSPTPCFGVYGSTYSDFPLGQIVDKAPHAYEIFNDKKEECVKVVVDPWA